MNNTTKNAFMLTFTLLSLSMMLQQTVAFDLGYFVDQLELNANPDIPQIQWPQAFEIVLSSNDPGLNITEKIYFDQSAKKLRVQIFYSILGLEPSKAVDLIIDEGQKRLALKTDVDCKQTSFKQSLSAVSLFFGLWNAFTDYEGQENGFSKFKSHLGSHDSSPKFYFYFDGDKQLKKVKLEQSMIGGFELQALHPVTERQFTEADFSYDECGEINSLILDEAMSFVSFMQSIVDELVGKEDYMMSILKGKASLFKPTIHNNDDDEGDYY